MAIAYSTMNKAFYTVKEIARLLQLNTLTIYDYIKLGKLKAVRFGRTYRIKENEFTKFVNKHEVNKS